MDIRRAQPENWLLPVSALDGILHFAQRFNEIRGELLLIFGDSDPHIPEDGRIKIDQALKRAGTRYRIQLFDGEHAFMRDEGPRFDPESTDLAFYEAITFLRKL